eukprot:6899366-Prymnesium_polylepis.1
MQERGGGRLAQLALNREIKNAPPRYRPVRCTWLCALGRCVASTCLRSIDKVESRWGVRGG